MYDMSDLDYLETFGAGAPSAMKAFMKFNDEALKDGAIPKKYKELMAVAVAMTTQCPYCIAYHKAEAESAGATREELAEAAFVSSVMRAWASVVHGTHLVK